MQRSWEAEKILEADVALQIIQEQFPEIKAKTIETLGIGWDNTAFLINNEWVFRFPRRQIAVPLIEIEYCFLPKIASNLPLSIPVPKWLGRPSEAFPWIFSGYKKLPGITACRSHLSEEERIEMVEPIARFLLNLHEIQVSEGKKCHLPGDTIGRLNIERLRGEIRRNLQELSSLGFPIYQKKVDQILFIDASPKADTIVHGDFYVRHLLVQNRKLTGVIDWGDIHIGDKAVDLSIVHSFFPRAAHDKFQRIYGEISEETWNLAKLRALHHSAILAIYGHHTKDQDIKTEALRSLLLIELIPT